MFNKKNLKLIKSILNSHINQIGSAVDYANKYMIPSKVKNKHIEKLSKNLDQSVELYNKVCKELK